MKPHLKRIEATLHQLGILSAASYPEPAASLKNRTYSFKIRKEAQKRSNLGLQTFSAKQSSSKAPTLPKLKFPGFISHRQVTKPALTMNPLPKIQTDVAACKAELQQILQQIKDIYLEGPIVDGWLESHPRTPEQGSATPNLGKVDRPIDYVEEVCSFEQGKVTCESPRAGYRLCGRDAAGQMWSLKCPLEQLPSVSIAIARYHKLRQLLDRKQYLKARLSQLQS